MSQEFFASPWRFAALPRSSASRRRVPCGAAPGCPPGRRGRSCGSTRSLVAAAVDRLADDDPGIVVAEDARVFLVAGRVGWKSPRAPGGSGNRAGPPRTIPYFVSRCSPRESSDPPDNPTRADFRHGAEALRLDEDPALLALGGADLVARVVVGAQVPLPVPAVLDDAPSAKIAISASRERRLVEAARGRSPRSRARSARTCRR